MGYSPPVVLKLECASQSPGGLVLKKTAAPHTQNF